MFLSRILTIIFLYSLITINGFSQEASWRDLNKQAESLVVQKKYDDAEILYQRILEMVEKKYGPESSVTVYILYRMSYTYHRDSVDHYSSNKQRSKDMLAKALHPIERALTILEKTKKKVGLTGGDKKDRYIISLEEDIRSLYRTCASNLAKEYKLKGKLSKSEQLYKSVVEVAQESDWLHNSRLVEVYLLENKYAEAEHLSEICLELAEKQYSPHGHKVMKSLEYLLEAYLKQKKYLEAGPKLRHYASIVEKKYGTNGNSIILETIFLKTGQRIEGKILEITDSYIKVEFLGVPESATYLLDDIDSIYMARAKKRDRVESVVFTGAPAIPKDAIRNRRISDVKEAIENGADVNARYAFGTTALMLAVMTRYKESSELTRLLIKNGADVNASSDRGETVLSDALQGTLDTFKLLIEHGANIDAQDRRGKTALMEYAGGGVVDRVILLIEAGVDIDLKDKEGKTALIYAANYGQFDIAKLLVVNGANVNIKDNDGMTALRHAQDEGDDRMVTLFSVSGQKYISSLKDIDEDAKSHFDKAQNLLAKKKEEQALSELKKVIKISPKYLLAYHAIGSEFVMGLSFMYRGNTIELLKIFEKAVQANPEDPECYFYLGQLYQGIGRLFDARAAYEKAKDLYNEGAMATQLWISGMIDRILEEVNDKIDKMEKKIGRDKVSTMSESEKLEAAKYCIQKAEGAGMAGWEYYSYAINITPDNPETAMAYVGVGDMYFGHEGADIAIYYYQKGIELDPELAEAYYGLAKMYYILVRMEGEQQKLDLAKKAYEKAKDLFKKQGKLEMLKEMEDIISMFEL